MGCSVRGREWKRNRECERGERERENDAVKGNVRKRECGRKIKTEKEKRERETKRMYWAIKVTSISLQVIFILIFVSLGRIWTQW